jgi:cyanophycinase-like exopeptidase
VTNRDRMLVILAAPLLSWLAAPSVGAITPAPAPTKCVSTSFAPAGAYDAHSARRGPGLVLSGAGADSTPPAAFAWIRAHIGASDAARAGNVVILRASGERESTDLFYSRGRFAWVQEILIPPCAPRAAVDAVAATVDRADAVFFSGGDQANYVLWKGSALIDAVRRVYARRGIVGGGSAGLAIQGQVVYDSVAADRLHPGDDDYNVRTSNAVPNPLEPEISFTVGLFAWPPLSNTITDTHFVARDRFGRLVVFLTRILHDGLGTAPFYGLGVDEGSVVLVDADGRATVRRSPKSHGAYLVRMSSAPELHAGRPFNATVAVMHVGRDGEHFDLAHKSGAAPWYSVTVDGTRTPPYSRDPYR